jgi:hypothetical protein
MHLHVTGIYRRDEVWNVCIENMMPNFAWRAKFIQILLYLQCFIAEYHYVHIILREINFRYKVRYCH